MRGPLATGLGLLGVLGACATPLPGPREVPAPTVPTDVLPGGAGGDAAYPVEVLETRARYVFAADGTQTRTQTVRYRVRRVDESLGSWAAVSATWSPWFQDRPEISATVTRRGGAAFDLDPSTVSEQPVESGQRGLYTDRRRLEAPLPGLAPGAEVEHTVVSRDRRPFLEGGALTRFFFGAGVPLPRVTLEVVVPEGVPLTYQLRGLGLTPTERRENGQVILTFEATDLPARGPTRLLLPPEHPRYPHVLLSTVPSWQSAAAVYAARVEAQLEGADVSSLLTGLDREQPREQIIGTLLSRLHGEIRYTALELGEQALLPRRPEETLGRRFGDCKDKGVLLIALLRAVGIEAHLAVLKSGLGEDIAPEIPGLELFNHAIVYLPGERPLWIDATQELLPAGQLPLEVQGRHALVVDKGGPGLLRVPEVDPSDNRYVEVRQVKFPDWGPVSVRERTEATGTMEHRLRRQLLGAGRSQVQSSLSRYVQRSYRAKRIGDFDYGDARDVSVPFAVEVEALDARIGFTVRRTARVQLRTPVLFGFVPDLLRDAALGQAAEDDDRERKAAALLVRTRSADMQLPQAFEAEVRYRLVPPDGFELKTAPDPVDQALGPGRYRFELRPESDGSLSAILTLSTGKRRYTANEARAFVAGLTKVWEMPVPTIEFVHTGARLMEAGKPRAAIAAYRALVSSSPDRASHRARFAEALLETGLGGAARAEARAAAEMAPESAPILMALGHVLEADPYGRARAPGFDRAGALAAFEKVLVLDEDHVGARLARARLLELDERGRPATDPAAWRAAADAYRGLRDRTGDTEFDARLMLAHYWGEDFESLHELASKLPPKAPNVAMQLVGAAKTKGVRAALTELDRLGLPPEPRQEALETAANSLARVRAYEAARRLTQAALPTAADPMSLQRRLVSLSDVAAVQLERLESKTPQGAVQRLLYAMLDPPLEVERIRALFSARAFDTDDSEEDLAALAASLGVFSRSASRADVPLAMVRDNILSLTKFEVSGGPGIGYRVEGRMTAGAQKRESVWYVVKEKGGYRVRASERSPAALGEEALHLLGRGKVRAGRRWLEWATSSLRVGDTEDEPLSAAPFIALRAVEAPLVVQAAALVAMGLRAERARDHLERAKAALEAPAARAALEHALWMVHVRAGRHADAAAAAARLLELVPRSTRAFWLRCDSLVSAGERDEARRLAEARLAASKGDEVALGCLSDAALAEGDVASARRWLGEQMSGGRASDPVLLNNQAWLSLFAGEVTDKDVDDSLRSNAMTAFEDPSKLHTLAALYAEQGKTREAHQLFVKRLELRGADEPEHVDWYLIGRIMEQFELFELAAEAYGRVRPEAREADSTHRLAQGRLARLRAR